jgi:hypothetical protein
VDTNVNIHRGDKKMRNNTEAHIIPKVQDAFKQDTCKDVDITVNLPADLVRQLKETDIAEKEICNAVGVFIVCCLTFHGPGDVARWSAVMLTAVREVNTKMCGGSEVGDAIKDVLDGMPKEPKFMCGFSQLGDATGILDTLVQSYTGGITADTLSKVEEILKSVKGGVGAGVGSTKSLDVEDLGKVIELSSKKDNDTVH